MVHNLETSYSFSGLNHLTQPEHPNHPLPLIPECDHARAHTHPRVPCEAEAVSRWLHTGCRTFAIVSAPGPTPTGGRRQGGFLVLGGRSAPPPPAPYGLHPGPSAFHCPAPAEGLPQPACRGVKFMWPGLELAVTGPHTHMQTYTGHPLPCYM